LEQETIQLGRYRLIAELAHGGMGDVYLGAAQGPAGFSKLMVIKVLRAALADDEQFLTMFLEEARLAARLNHPNVVQTVEVGVEGRHHFLAMEYLEGQSLQRLRQRVAKEHPFPLGPHLRILVEALNGLHYAHELVDIDGHALNIVHRDATPHNLFVTYDGQVKLVDFGIAKAMDSSLETRTGELKGKIGYMPPEQASSERVDRRADVFAMGVMVWEAAVGRRLWKGLNEVAIMHELVMGKIPSPREIDPRVPIELEEICQRALARRPEDRYPTAADFAADLERFLVTIGDRTTTRDIARIVSDAFDSDRRELREIIDGQLRMLRQGDSAVASGPMPKLSSAALGGGGTPSVSLAQPSAAQLDRGVAPSYTAGGTASVAAVPKKGVPLVAGAAIAVAAAIVGFVVFLAVHHDPHAAPLALSVIDTPARASAESIEVTITTTPPAATLFLDDAPLGPSPFHQTFPRDNLAHRIRAEAQSYGSRTELVVFDKPVVQREIELSKSSVPAVASTYVAPPPPKATAVHTAAAAPTNPEPVGSGAGQHKPPRQIDTSFGP
jgi:serine/threonine protein kinase